MLKQTEEKEPVESILLAMANPLISIQPPHFCLLKDIAPVIFSFSLTSWVFSFLLSLIHLLSRYCPFPPFHCQQNTLNEVSIIVVSNFLPLIVSSVNSGAWWWGGVVYPPFYWKIPVKVIDPSKIFISANKNSILTIAKVQCFTVILYSSLILGPYIWFFSKYCWLPSKYIQNLITSYHIYC